MNKTLISMLVISIGCLYCLSACGQVDKPSSTSIPESPSSIAENSQEPDGTGGGSTIKAKYSFHYYSVDGSLIDYVGADNFDSWWKQNDGKELSILDFVRDFQISKDVFLAVTRPGLDADSLAQVESMGFTEESWYDDIYTLDEVDAIYSNDSFTVNRTFCSPVAVFNESDGEIYTLEWLAEHNTNDYLAVGLSLHAIQEVLDRVQTTDEYQYLAPLEEEITPILEEAEALAANR